MGTTARALQMCQENLHNLTNDLRQDGQERCNVLKEILEVYKLMRKSWENSINKTEEQLKVANTLREDRNTLLREFLLSKKGQ